MVTTLEREFTIPAGKTSSFDVTLSPAPPPKEIIKVIEAPAPPPAAAPVGPVGQPQTLNIDDLLNEKSFVGRDPRRDTLVACSGNMRAMMIQLNEPQPERIYDNADLIYYVMGGEGAVRMDGRETVLKTSGIVSVPRRVPHSLTRRGNRPFILLAVISGEPCESAK
jgi:mannose-6-phosphate isomerase-like protein (cupin superfamily)